MTRLARLSSLTGLGLADLGILSEGQLAGVADVAAIEERRRAWSQDTELLAGILDTLRRIEARLDAGLRVAFDHKIPAPRSVPAITRPEWVQESPTSPETTTSDATVSRRGEKVVSPREFFAMFRRR